jgi:glycosyltransferase involved in cell wall biosynthesis
MSLLSIAIIARDEERLIEGCLESIAGVADDVIVLLDDRTRDRTATLAQTYGAYVVLEPWRGYSAQRNRALQLCRSEWVLFVDADERLTNELRHELQAMREQVLALPFSSASSAAGYWIPRYNLFFDQIVHGGGWYPDYQLRLVRRDRAQFNEQQMVHEVAMVGGTTARLQQHLLHINIERVGEFWRKQAAYALSEARTLAAEGHSTRLRNFIGAPAREFWRRYVQLEGRQDGVLGLFLCGSLAWFEVVKYGCLLLIEEDTGHQGVC